VGATDFAKLTERYQVAASTDGVSRLADELGVSPQSLQRLRIGWDGAAWTFPMQDAAGTVTGIRRRFPNGRKLSVKGSCEGLFVPDGIGRSEQLMVCEGPTDTAAMLTLGFNAVGRPSCRGGVPLLATFCKCIAVVIVADRDQPGKSGAEYLARRLLLVCPSVKVISPPHGVADARDWVRGGATHNDVSECVAAVSPWRLTIETKRRRPAQERRREG